MYFSFKDKNFVKNIFSSVASKYDIMNDVMCLGLHTSWKKTFIEKIDSGSSLLDVASGTSDIGFLYYKKLLTGNSSSTKIPEIILLDINLEMMLQGRDKLLNKGIFQSLSYIVGNAEELPFADNSFDTYTIAFGLRNIENPYKALMEAYRILKPGGKFLCMEFSRPINSITNYAYKAYSKLIPIFGKYIAKNEEAYKYLVDSIQHFVENNIAIDAFEQSGLKELKITPLVGGVVSIYEGFKII